MNSRVALIQTLTVPTRSLIGVLAASFVFATLLHPALQAQTVSNVYSFQTNSTSQQPEVVMPVQGLDAELYLTTAGVSPSVGSVFKLQTNGTGSQLYAFDTTNGATPFEGLTLATDGYYYGVAEAGGTKKLGVLFRITSDGSYTVLHNFLGGTDGASPTGPPIEASDGNLYGTTKGRPKVASTVYQYASNGTFSTIYQFSGFGTNVIAPLIEGSDGNLYGTSENGGTNACGSLFKMTKAGAVLETYSFPCGSGGSLPVDPLLQASDGNFYGTAKAGGTQGYGIVFKWDQQGNFSILHDFAGGSDGLTPFAGLVQTTDGNLYGTAGGGGVYKSGTLYKIAPDGTYTMLYSFSQKTVGREPKGTLLQHTNGTLYGTTKTGGASNFGAVYSVGLGLSPFIAFVQPTGAVGQTAQILGTGLIGATSVTFNGVTAASISVASDTYMTAVVPPSATTGPVVVTTPTATLTSNVSFRILN
jgi:uncharacterized repeat protein (TIGR03803 family)